MMPPPGRVIEILSGFRFGEGPGARLENFRNNWVALGVRPATVPTPMPKAIARRKTKKAVAKRFKITATGKILRRKPGLRHLASSKSAKRKRKLGKVGQVHETMVARVKE